MAAQLKIRPARAGDLAALRPVIERAYRTDAGWTHEAHLVPTPRTDAASLAATLADPRERLLAAERGEAMIGCVQVGDRGDGLAYLGLLTVDPLCQAAGLGGRLIESAEALAASEFGATRMELTVIDSREELLGWYARRGYRPTGETRPFPVPLDPPLTMVVLEKAL